MIKYFISTLNPIILQIFGNNYLLSFETGLSNLSSNSEIFHEASKHYKNILNQSGYDYKLQYKPPNNENGNKSKSPKNRRRNIIWFNSSFSKNVSNNIGKYFLLLFLKYFPNNRKYHKIFNKNNVKISYRCLANIKSMINTHNKEVIAEEKTEAVKCNRINKPDCPFSNQCQITNLIYKAKITSNLQNYNEKIYCRTRKRTFKQRYETIRYHSIMKNIGQIQNFRRNTGDLKKSKQNLKCNFTF